MLPSLSRRCIIFPPSSSEIRQGDTWFNLLYLPLICIHCSDQYSGGALQDPSGLRWGNSWAYIFTSLEKWKQATLKVLLPKRERTLVSWTDCVCVCVCCCQPIMLFTGFTCTNIKCKMSKLSKRWTWRFKVQSRIKVGGRLKIREGG